MVEVAFPRDDKEGRSVDVDKDAEYSSLYDEFLNGPPIIAPEEAEEKALFDERMVSFGPEEGD